MYPIATAATYIAMSCTLLAWASWLLRRGGPTITSRWPAPRNYALVAMLGVIGVITLGLATDTRLLRALPSAALWTVVLMIPIQWVSAAIRLHGDRAHRRPESVPRR